MLLADLGAEVIKIETGEGDIARNTGGNEFAGHNVYFASLNRNKKSVALDLTRAADRVCFDRLVTSAHGLITNYRPRAIKKLGLTYDALKEVNPDLACMALTGFGLEGPYSEYPAYDYIIQAMTGVTMLTGEPNGPPVRAGYSVVDNTGGMMAAIGLLAKLLQKQGGQAEVALYDIMLSQMNYLAAAYLNAHQEPQRHPSGGHSYFVPAQIFGTRDGHIALFITHDAFWESFAREVGRDAWLTDERFATMHARNRNRDVVVEAVTAELATRTSDEWLARLQPLGLVVGKVATLNAALADKGTIARDMIASLPTSEGTMRLIANPIRIGGFTERYSLPPLLGEHSAEYLGAAHGLPGA